MSVMPDRAQPGELSVRTKAVVRTVGGTKVYITKSRAVPIRIGKGKSVKKWPVTVESVDASARSVKKAERQAQTTSAKAKGSKKNSRSI